MVKFLEDRTGLPNFVNDDGVVYVAIDVGNEPKLLKVADLRTGKMTLDGAVRSILDDWYMGRDREKAEQAKLEKLLAGNNILGAFVIAAAEGLLVFRTRHFIATMDYRLLGWRLKFIGDGGLQNSAYVPVVNPVPDKVLCMEFTDEGFVDRLFLEEEAVPSSMLTMLPVNVWQCSPQCGSTGEGVLLFYQRCNPVLYASKDGTQYQYHFVGKYFTDVAGDQAVKYRLDAHQQLVLIPTP